MIPAGRGLSSVLIVSPAESGERIASMLDCMEYGPIKKITNASQARRQTAHDSFDIIIINAPLCDDEGYELALDIAESSGSAVMLAVRGESYDEVRYRVESAGIFTIPKPLSAATFHSALNLIRMSQKRLMALEAENKKLRLKIEELKLIDRAKWMLITEKGMDEAAAHRYIEKGAMDSRMTRADYARAVIGELG